jgi:glycosyltransferase involved in cell wall biosynthesis
MRILLAQGLVYLPTFGGANKGNRLVLEALAGRGHECRVVAPASGVQSGGSAAAAQAELARRGIPFVSDAEADVFASRGVSVTAITQPARMAARLRREIEQGVPDLVLVGSEDPGYVLLDTALRAAPSRVVYVARTTNAVPFGPDALLPSVRARARVGQAAGVMVASAFLRDYCATWAGVAARVLPISPHGSGPFPMLGRYENRFVTMINPCAYKGLPIFLAMARACPDLAFAAVPTWGTTDADRVEMRSVENLALIDPADDIEDILRLTRVLVVPSLWIENKARVITEAMLRGIPVLASDVGGNAEAMHGVDHLLPVTPIAAVTPRIDDRLLPVALVPPQDPRPWVDALRAVLATREAYDRLARASRDAALAAEGRESIDDVEAYLDSLRAACV